MTSEIDKLKHFHVENYSGTNFTDDLNDGEEFLYTTIRCKDDKEVTLCLLQQHDINKGWMPKPTQIIDCVEVEISPENWIMAVDINNIDLIKLDINYNIQWKECSCLRGIRLEDVTVELEKEAYEEMRNNK